MDTPVKNPKLPYWFCSPATCSVLSLCYECLTAWAFLLLSSYSLLYIYISSNLGTFSQFRNSFAILPISLRVFCLHVHFFILSANSFCCSPSFCINTPIFTFSLSSFSIRKKKNPAIKVFKSCLAGRKLLQRMWRGERRAVNTSFF